jgi:hypothetical protein
MPPMPTYKSSVSIEASPEQAWDAIERLTDLPGFLTPALVVGGGEAWVRFNEGRRHRVEWGEEGGYRAWLEVDREGEVCSVTVRIHADTGADEVDRELDQTLFALKAAVEEDASGSTSSSS